jgi:UDP-hydrolysing UDP-N-acetyl-D-glucosamine 2-epimerase
MSRILSVSSSRADIGALAPVWRALAAISNVDLHVFLTGMHRVDDSMARAALPEGVTLHSGGADLGGASPAKAATAMARIETDTGALLADIRPDIVLVMGDRLDMFPAAAATLPFNLPLAHLHGGEVTEGAIDDRIRHAITKLAHIHCVSTQGARARLLAMGEDDARIHVTGAPGLDTLKAAPTLSADAFAVEAGLKGIEGDLAALRLVTVHPETNAADALAPLTALLSALEARPAPTLFTAPNSDPGGAEMRRRIEAFVARHPWARFRDTLGMRLYANALRHAAVMVGNSSSGIIEAGLFGLPVINVGDRQKGRERGANVTDVAGEALAVGLALDRLGARPARLAPCSPYGDGNAGPRVAEAIVSFGPIRQIRRKPNTELTSQSNAKACGRSAAIDAN